MESPCILVCSIEPTTGWCRGCGRTTREIGAWTLLDDAGRAAVMAELPTRMETLPPPPRERRVTRRQRLREARQDAPGGDGKRGGDGERGDDA